STYGVSLVIDPVTPSTLYASTFVFATRPQGNPFDDGQGIVAKSTDGGETWTVIRAGIPAGAFVRTLAIDPASPSTVYASFSGESGEWRVLKSTDSGQNWKVLDTGLAPYRVNSLVAVSPGIPSTIYAGYIDFSRGRGRLVKSMDGGASWAAADSGLTYIDART